MTKNEKIVLDYFKQEIEKEYIRREDRSKKLMEEGVITKPLNNENIKNYTYDNGVLDWKGFSICNTGIKGLIEGCNVLAAQRTAKKPSFRILEPTGVRGDYKSIEIHTLSDIENLKLNNRRKYLYYISDRGRINDRPKQIKLDFTKYVFDYYPKNVAEVLMVE